MSTPIKITRALLQADSTIGPQIGARAYRAGAIQQNARRPFVALEVLAADDDRDLDGVSDGRSAAVRLTVVGDTAAQVDAILDPIAAGALNGKQGVVAGETLLGTTVEDESITDVSSEPLDLDDGQAFVAQAVLELAYL